MVAHDLGPAVAVSIHFLWKFQVWCEVIPPFNLMPRSFLESTVSAVLSGVVNSLLPMFLRRLAEDYTNWAADPDYRLERAQRRMPLS